MANNNIYSRSSHLSLEQMIDYSNRGLVGIELHEVEKHLVDCSLCNDAIEGMRHTNTTNVLAATDELRRIVRKRRYIKKPIISQTEKITLVAVLLLILFLIIISMILFIKK